MYLKRKRSESEISTASSLLPSPLHSNNANSMNIDSTSIASPNLFSSRTRKRHRDNRPNEETVHQHTLSLLYSAQQPSNIDTSCMSPPSPSAISPRTIIPHPPNNPAHQASLHSFWQLPSNRQISPDSDSSYASSTSVSPKTITHHLFLPTNCEDCDESLANREGGDEMDVDTIMDINMHGTGETNHGCTSCGKQVCHSCAVSNLGMERKCLSCAGRERDGRKWVGGLGWMN
ncbi:hypothetical protein SS1G_04346 [Sclerotinia sclerotiorum 1980 UF-70]|uniref:Uncharacterized protein n=2 Tax=Sclerotinia sclerotiorum (strain ATCC 18683 / 1980 / Ss-1) TaxID=665079 RepID=A7EGA5_SCLS1|nr:hypothetical protein SS1G_04346 [Sclerotinia sclerotiorum 1980 UF-70]APA06975.1 hypothetical protein sscle_02g017450 [Sclerotinia sclerotiorum 1980 UF-70]EDO01871.1 hypothetical protein SS1G_04346 [Sclerotinia sclerotiorum 1980 UF-70]